MILDDREFGIGDLMAVASGKRRVRLSPDPAWTDKMERSRACLQDALSAGHPVYGVSTGVGHDSGRRIEPEKTENFAYQIIRQHGCGVGDPFSETEARAIVFSRLVCLAKGYSAVRPSLLQALCDLLNKGVIPVIPSLGSVGASGDLTPLSYVAAVLAGEREAYYNGEVLPAEEALKHAGLTPHRFAPKESLSIMNGTSVMSAIGAVVVHRFDRTLSVCERAAALAAEVLYGRSQAFHPTVHRLKGHEGQIASAEAIRTATEGALMMDGVDDVDRVDGVDKPRRLIQDPYSIRCAPQVIGAARDALAWAEQQVLRELNSVNDNPIVDPDTGEVLFAGNFYGGHIALAMDLIKNAAATVADLLDRHFALLVDSRLNGGLPETLAGYDGCGLKALQLTCSALAARTVQQSAPDAVTSRPTEVHNQDKVSMGLNAALTAGEAVALVQQTLATVLIALSNAAALRDEARFSPGGRAFLAKIRAVSPVLAHDRRLDGDLNGLVRVMGETIEDFENKE